MAAFAGAMMLSAMPAIFAYPNFKVDPNKYASSLFLDNMNSKTLLHLLVPVLMGLLTAWYH